MSYGQTYANDLFAIDAAASERAVFLRRTYIHLFGAILAFIGLEAVMFSLFTPRQMIQATWGQGTIGMLVVIGGFIFASWIARSWANSVASPTMQYLGLGLYTVVQAALLAPMISLATLMDGGTGNIVMTAGVITLLTFGGLTAIVLASGANFSFLRTGLIVGGWAAFVTVLAAMFMGFSLGLLFCSAMVILACGYILYDTSNVLHHYRTDQHVGAALELFASVALLFYYVLRIVMILQSRD